MSERPKTEWERKLDLRRMEFVGDAKDGGYFLDRWPKRTTVILNKRLRGTDRRRPFTRADFYGEDGYANAKEWARFQVNMSRPREG